MRNILLTVFAAMRGTASVHAESLPPGFERLKQAIELPFFVSGEQVCSSA